MSRSMKINLSVTCYMAVATVAPTLVGDAADVQNRRLVYAIVLSLHVGANAALALAKSYRAHLGLRGALAAAQASSNTMRCTMAAIVMAFLQDLIDKVGVGWAFTFMGGLCFIALGLFLVDSHRGAARRQQNIRRTSRFTAPLSV